VGRPATVNHGRATERARRPRLTPTGSATRSPGRGG
jgi:hypothetical protein